MLMVAITLIVIWMEIMSRAAFRGGSLLRGERGSRNGEKRNRHIAHVWWNVRTIRVRSENRKRTASEGVDAVHHSSLTRQWGWMILTSQTCWFRSAALLGWCPSRMPSLCTFDVRSAEGADPVRPAVAIHSARSHWFRSTLSWTPIFPARIPSYWSNHNLSHYEFALLAPALPIVRMRFALTALLLCNRVNVFV